MMRSSLALRLVLGAAIWTSLALGVVGIVLSSLFSQHITLNFVRQLSGEINALAAGLEWDEQGELKLSRQLADVAFERPYSGRYWQASIGGAARLRSRSLWDRDLTVPDGRPARAAASRLERLTGPQDQKLLALRRTVVLPGRDVPVDLVVTLDREEFTTARRRFDRLLAVSLGGVGVALLLATVAQVAYGLWPLRRLQAAVADVRARRHSRVVGQWPAEVLPIVAELNAVLDRNEAGIERARRQASDLAHAIKTPLAVLSNQASARPDDPFAREVAAQLEAMRHRLERHLARARAVGSARRAGAAVSVESVADGLIRAMRVLYASRELTLARSGTGRFPGDEQDLAEMLGNLLDNACKWAARSVRVGIAQAGGRLTIRVEDDGPGMPAGDRDRAVRPYERLDESVSGSGLGLAIVADIASLYDGGLALQRSGAGGVLAVLDLPAI